MFTSAFYTRKLFVLIVCCTVANLLSAQVSIQANWTWMNGSNGIGASSIYGDPGIYSPSFSPGSRSGALTWTADDGSFYLFGGSTLSQKGGSQNVSEDLDDLWKYDPATNRWAVIILPDTLDIIIKTV